MDTPEVLANDSPMDGAGAAVPLVDDDDGDDVGEEPKEKRKGLAAPDVDVGLGEEKDPKEPKDEVAPFC